MMPFGQTERGAQLIDNGHYLFNFIVICFGHSFPFLDTAYQIVL
jgi:hypothetical protein